MVIRNAISSSAVLSAQPNCLTIQEAADQLRQCLKELKPRMGGVVPELLALAHVTDLASKGREFYPLTKENIYERFERRATPR